MILKWLAEGLNLVYPPLPGCAICGDEETDSLCFRCRGKLSQSAREEKRCPRCGRGTNFEGQCSMCSDGYYGADGGAAAWEYQETLRDLIIAYKFNARRDVAPILAESMVEAARALLPLSEIDAVLWVPVHWMRYLQRGYDQAEELAALVSQQLRIPLIKGGLRRIKYNRPLSTFTGGARKRRELVSGCFSVHRQCKGKTLLLVDDILTTGATLTVCAQELRKAGAARVYTLVAAAVPDKIEQDNS